MLIDLVLDTNVLVHADNPNTANFKPARKFLNGLLNSTTNLCLDKGFSSNRADNRSIIMGEYFDNISHGTIGYVIVQTLAANDRIRGVDKKASQHDRNIINQKIYDKSDRIFVKVTLNTMEHVFVSHDFKHFPDDLRVSLNSDIGINIYDCGKCHSYLS